ncbi:MAG TPA: hypothetical protein VMM82_01175 [Spirochaetia bacterium]|nr:hypothetical protein [Spirochaetia bacterium]
MTKAIPLVLLCLLAACGLSALDKAAPGSMAAAPTPLLPRGAPNGSVELDRNGDGVVDYRVYYDARGKVAREELDFNFDGKMDTFYYYKDGVLQREELDTRFNGQIDIWVYLLEGTYVQRYERDLDGDGKPDIVRDFGGK